MKLTFTLIALFSYCLLNAQKAGMLDRSFGDTGVVMGSAYSGKCQNLLIQTDGKIISTGIGGYNNVGGFLVVQYNKDGSTDLSFGDSGRVATNLSNIGSNGGYSALQPDGKIVVTGIARYNGDVTQKQIIVKKIKHYIQTHNDAQAITLNNIFIYPNPVQNILHVDGLSSTQTKLTVVDFAGNIKLQAATGNNSYNLNIASLQAGNYVLKIEINDDVISKKFIKQ